MTTALIQPLILVALLAVQFLTGFEVIKLSPDSFRRVHLYVAWTLVALFLLHGFEPLLYFTSPLVTMQVLVLPAELILIALLALEMLVGSGIIRTRDRFKFVHVALAISIVVVGSLHGVGLALGVSHPRSDDCVSCHRPPPFHDLPNCHQCHNVPHSWASHPTGLP